MNPASQNTPAVPVSPSAPQPAVPQPEDFDALVPDSSAEQHTPQANEPQPPSAPLPR